MWEAQLGILNTRYSMGVHFVFDMAMQVKFIRNVSECLCLYDARDV